MNTDKPYIVRDECLLSSWFIIQNISLFFLFSYSDSDIFIHRDFLECLKFCFFCDAHVDFLREGALWLPIWMKHALHVFIALNNGQPILFWVKIWKIIPLLKYILSRHIIIHAFSSIKKFTLVFVVNLLQKNTLMFQAFNQTELIWKTWYLKPRYLLSRGLTVLLHP